jgi:transposase
VENAVQQVERRILARIRDHTFHSIEEINAAIEPLLTELNERSTRSLGTSRKQLFDTIDRPALGALPEHPFGEGEWSKARVSIDYHVVVDGHRYSVPFTFIGSVVEIRLAQHTVEMFLDGARLASHLRSRVRNSFTTHKEHMPPNHQQAQWQETRFLAQAKKHGPETERFAMRLLDTRPVREQAFRSCMGILRLGDKYGSTRLEAACERALITDAISYKSVDAILKSGLDRHPISKGELDLPPILHGNIRGADYYGSIGVNGVSSTKPFDPHATQQTREVEHA